MCIVCKFEFNFPTLSFVIKNKTNSYCQTPDAQIALKEELCYKLGNIMFSGPSWFTLLTLHSEGELHRELEIIFHSQTIDILTIQFFIYHSTVGNSQSCTNLVFMPLSTQVRKTSPFSGFLNITSARQLCVKDHY